MCTVYISYTRSVDREMQQVGRRVTELSTELEEVNTHLINASDERRRYAPLSQQWRWLLK